MTKIDRYRDFYARLATSKDGIPECLRTRYDDIVRTMPPSVLYAVRQEMGKLRIHMDQNGMEGVPVVVRIDGPGLTLGTPTKRNPQRDLIHEAALLLALAGAIN